MGHTATVVVPTFRRPAGLTRVLAALAGQLDPGVRWDVVVVDNDDPPGATATFEEHARAVGVSVRLVRESERGASHTRNRGIAEATGSIIVFLDDDVVPAQDWLATLVEPIVAGRCNGTGGRVVLDPSVTRPEWFDEPGLGGYLAAHDPSPVEREVVEDEFVITANAAFDTAILRAGGGFDPQLGPREGTQLVNDDVLLCDRFIACGGRVHHVPAAVVVHELPAQRLRPRYLLARAHTQGRSDWILLAMRIGRRGAVENQVHWIGHEMKLRWREGPLRASTAFHACCDVVRVAGAAREAISRRGRRPAFAPGRTRP
jgi:glycosyltransferase involved in cell wall biosynthesis